MPAEGDARGGPPRVADFWTALALVAGSVFFLWRTSRLPFLEASAAGVEAEWYASAAPVPYAVFGALLAMGVGLLGVAIRDGGAARPRVPWPAVARIGAAVAIPAAHVGALVPRVGFTLSSALVVAALIYGFHEGRAVPRAASVAAVAVPGLHALGAHAPQAE